MSKPNANIIPGWKMTFDQRRKYFQMWRAVREALGWEESREARMDWHDLAGLGRCSAKDIDRMTGFDAIKAHWLSVTQPDNLDAQLAQVNQPKLRMMTRIRTMAPENYWRAIARDKFHTEDLRDLDEKQLTDLRNTLEARMGKKEAEEPF